MRGPRHRSLCALTALVAGAAPAAAGAHGFGERYDLPVPLALWVTGAAAAVVVSFVAIAMFSRGIARGGRYPRWNILRSPAVSGLGRGVSAAVRVVSVALLALVVVAGIAGSPNPNRNLAPTVVWVIWWVGLAYASALIGNLWTIANPWAALFGWTEALYRKVGGGELALGRPYPPALGCWPAVLLFLAFAWAELVFPERALPAYLALMTLTYSALTWAGMSVFGRAAWLAWADPFARVFGLLARFAPTELRVADPAVCASCPVGCRDRDGECIDCADCFGRAPSARRELNLRPPGVGLLRNEVVSPSFAAFVILLLSAVTFDGFTATPAWSTIGTGLAGALPGLGGEPGAVIGTLGLLAMPLVFGAAYAAIAGGMAAAGGHQVPGHALRRAFVLSLMPIALGYHFAHYLTFLLVQGQRVIPLASDPFGFGWDLFGTAGYRLALDVVGARFAWYTAVVAIVAGHVVAVWVAHVTALREFGDRRLAIRTQYPMLALMVTYTVASLWIIAQPIVEGTAGG